MLRVLTHDNIFLAHIAVVTVWLAVISILSFLQLDVDKWKWAIGIIVNINLAFFYGAPLSTIFTVLKTRDSR